jgi:hypothetical protein
MQEARVHNCRSGGRTEIPGALIHEAQSPSFRYDSVEVGVVSTQNGQGDTRLEINTTDRALNRRSLLLGGATLAAASTFSSGASMQVARAQQQEAVQSRPNILFILADNVGYGVLSSYNGGILDTPTARIDKLADEGLRLTNFNVENQCTPSRAALMTGRLPIRSGIGKAIAAGAPGGLHPWEITLAEMLGDAGYRGKWHLGTGEDRLPTDQGFDEWFGYETTDVIYWAGKPGMPLRDVHHIREAKKGEQPRNLEVYDEDTRRRIDRMVTDRAVEYIAKSGEGGSPFFLYVAFAFAHHPVLAHPDFKGKSPRRRVWRQPAGARPQCRAPSRRADGRRHCREHRRCLGER